MSPWEEVANDPWTLRLIVPGGWLYALVTLADGGQQYTYSTTFVPYPANSYEDGLVKTRDALLTTLREIAKGEGRYSRDPLEHASNTIEDMKALALAAIAKAEEKTP